MPNKNEYRSFDEINFDLAIYKIEKEIAFSKILMSIDNTQQEVKNSLSPLNIIKSLGENFSSFYSSNNLKSILSTFAIKFLVSKFQK